MNYVNKIEPLNIIIMGKEYRVACPEEEKDNLRASAKLLNNKLSEIKQQGSVLGTERIAIMAALNISYDMVKSQDVVGQQRSHEQRLEKLQQEVHGVVEKFRQSRI